MKVVEVYKRGVRLNLSRAQYIVRRTATPQQFSLYLGSDLSRSGSAISAARTPLSSSTERPSGKPGYYEIMEDREVHKLSSWMDMSGVGSRSVLTRVSTSPLARVVRKCKPGFQAWRHPVEEGAEVQRHRIARRIDDMHRQRLRLERLQHQVERSCTPRCIHLIGHHLGQPGAGDRREDASLGRVHA